MDKVKNAAVQERSWISPCLLEGDAYSPHRRWIQDDDAERQ